MGTEGGESAGGIATRLGEEGGESAGGLGSHLDAFGGECIGGINVKSALDEYDLSFSTSTDLNIPCDETNHIPICGDEGVDIWLNDGCIFPMG